MTAMTQAHKNKIAAGLRAYHRTCGAGSKSKSRPAARTGNRGGCAVGKKTGKGGCTKGRKNRVRGNTTVAAAPSFAQFRTRRLIAAASARGLAPRPPGH
tara:strand:+ start:74 stop:370 length:297 start_codon:yes stop_codon:yes gene_type:complete